MADDDDSKAGELTTANFGWVKPNVGDSDDVWGGQLNADLDGIDSVVHSLQTSIPAPYVLPTASTSVLGGVKVDGSTIAISSGVISAAGASITVSDTAPSSPAAGALWFDSTGGQLYVWYVDPNTAQWVPTTNQMGGGYATPAYVDAARYGDNRIINGDMRIDQRNGGASGTTLGYTVDRWMYQASQTGKISWVRGAAIPSLGFGAYASLVSQSTYTSLAADNFIFGQPIEADAVTDFGWGTANAQPVTLSFWANASIGGTYGGSINNYAGTRCRPFSYTLAANVWTKIVVTIPGDTAGTWVMSGAAGALYLWFDLGAGANNRGAAGAWVNGNLVGVTGSVNLCATNGAGFNLTGVKLEVGSVATPYNRQSLAKSMADCQRYYQLSTIINQNTNNLNVNVVINTPFAVRMRASPTLTIASNTSVNMTAPTLNTTDSFWWASTNVSASGPYTLGLNITASAEL